MSKPTHDVTRARLANVSSLLSLFALALTPWLLSESSTQMDRALSLPSELIAHVPLSCERLELYVGYPGCNTECPQALALLVSGQALRDTGLSRTQRRTCALFLSMFPDQLKASARYAASFHPALIGVSLSPEALSSVLAQLGVEGSLSPRGTHKDLIYQLTLSEGGWRLTKATPSAQWSQVKERRP